MFVSTYGIDRFMKTALLSISFPIGTVNAQPNLALDFVTRCELSHQERALVKEANSVALGL